jgi:hypothetical protein
MKRQLDEFARGISVGFLNEIRREYNIKFTKSLPKGKLGTHLSRSARTYLDKFIDEVGNPVDLVSSDRRFWGCVVGVKAITDYVHLQYIAMDFPYLDKDPYIYNITRGGQSLIQQVFGRKLHHRSLIEQDIGKLDNKIIHNITTYGTKLGHDNSISFILDKFTVEDIELNITPPKWNDKILERITKDHKR